MVTDRIAQQSWRNLARELAQRNDVVELLLPPQDGDEPQNQNQNESQEPGQEQDQEQEQWTVRKVRLLQAYEDGGILIQQPPGFARREQASAINRVRLLLLDGLQRLEGCCEVAGSEEYDLNETTCLLALRLKPPGRIRSAQRRQFYRVNTFGGDQTIVITLTPLPHDVKMPQIDDATQVSEIEAAGPSMQATLVNISGGGAGVTVQLAEREARALMRACNFHVHMPLPTLPRALQLVAQLIHVRELAHGGAYLGLKFIFSSPRQQQHAEEALLQFATTIERRQLQRQRRA